MDLTAASHHVVDCGAGEIRHPADLNVEKQIGEVLVKHYPHVSWFVEANCEQGIATVELPDYHMKGNQPYGMYLILDNLKGWDDLNKKCIWAGGELLERAHVSLTRDYRYADKVDRD